MAETLLHQGKQYQATFWGHLRSELKNVTRKPGTAMLARKIRSVQWTYWHKNCNLWQAIGEMLQDLLGGSFSVLR